MKQLRDMSVVLNIDIIDEDKLVVLIREKFFVETHVATLII